MRFTQRAMKRIVFKFTRVKVDGNIYGIFKFLRFQIYPGKSGQRLHLAETKNKQASQRICLMQSNVLDFLDQLSTE